jgi:tetratricopeptide (TPR) repeat protein
MAVFRIAAVTLLLVCIATAQQEEEEESYDGYSEDIIKNAKRAAIAFNTGHVKQADKYVLAARAAFEGAVKMQPTGAQAYLNMATFMLNTNQLDDALEYFQKATDFLDKMSDDYFDHIAIIEESVAKAKFGQLSMRRDAAYDGGKGDMAKARVLAVEQLKETPDGKFRLAHDLATMETMLCSSGTDKAAKQMCTAAQSNFKYAMDLTFEKWQAFRKTKAKKETGKHFKASKVYVGSWKDHRHVESYPVPDAPGLELNNVKKTVRLMGNEGVAVFETSADCSVLLPASDRYINLANNLFPQTPVTDNWRFGQPHILSLVQYAGASFYHWMCEGLPRLAVAQKIYGDGAPLSVLVPKKTIYHRGSIELLQQRVKIEQYYPNSRVDHLCYVTWDPQPCPDKSPNDPAAQHCHALAHPHALRLARITLVDGLDRIARVEDRQPKRTVVYASRGGTTKMRKFNEGDFIGKLKAAVGSKAEVIIHDSAPVSLSLANFRNAAVVVGAHGGSLANMMACKEGTAIVEIGFPGPAARHYEHVAGALGLEYTMIPVIPDALGRGLGSPQIAFDSEAVIQQVLDDLKKQGDLTNDWPAVEEEL